MPVLADAPIAPGAADLGTEIEPANNVDFAAKLAMGAWLQGVDPVRAVPRPAGAAGPVAVRRARGAPRRAAGRLRVRRAVQAASARLAHG